MKLLTSVILLVMSQAFAMDSIVVRGNLFDNIQMSERIHKVILTESEEELSLVNDFNEAPSCERGEYEVAKNTEGSFELKRIVKCDSFVDETALVRMCPEMFMPVCGELTENSNSIVPQLETFSNMCDLYVSKANFVKFGRCD